MAEQYRREIGRRTKRSLMERARAGKLVGGRAYGYRIEGDKRKINRAEAKIVLRIYEQRAKGWSALRIVRHLNEDGVPPPGEHWNRKAANKTVWRTSATAGDHRRGIGILNNELYRGNVIWNSFEWVRSAADSSKRKPVKRPRDQWVIRHDESLCIVPEARWLKVQKVQTEDSPKRTAIRNGIKNSPWKARPKWWLSGVLACDSCKSNLTISGHDYICPSAHGGSCNNRIRIRKAEVETEMLDLLRKHLLDPDRMRGEIKRVEKVLKEREKDELAELRRSAEGTDLREVKAEIAVIRKANFSLSVNEAALNAALLKKAEIEERLGKKTPGTTVARQMLARLPTLAKDYAKSIGAALGKEASQDAIADARMAISELIQGGKVYMKGGKEDAQARVVFLGLGAFVLRVANVPASARSSGSGGRI